MTLIVQLDHPTDAVLLQEPPGSQSCGPADLSHQAHRQLIGFLGILLPWLLILLAGVLPTEGLPRWGLLRSVSSYYYTGGVAAFVGILVALSLFLFTYGGYKGYVADRVIGVVGGLCALGVAFFPTQPPSGVPGPTWWTNWMRSVHYVSAILLFGVFILFSLWLFRKTNVPRGEELPRDKRWRNRVFLACGLVMVACVLWAASAIVTRFSIFWPESIALTAFASSWLVKGYAYKPAVRMVKGVMGRS